MRTLIFRVPVFTEQSSKIRTEKCPSMLAILKSFLTFACAVETCTMKRPGTKGEEINERR